MHALFLPTVMGWYFLIFGLLVLIRTDFVKLAAEDVMKSRGQYFMLALITLILGLLIVASHNIWIAAWPVVVTVLGWLILIGGLVRLFFAESSRKMGAEFLKSPTKMRVVGIIAVIIGLYLLIHVHHVHFLLKLGL